MTFAEDKPTVLAPHFTEQAGNYASSFLVTWYKRPLGILSFNPGQKNISDDQLHWEPINPALCDIFKQDYGRSDLMPVTIRNLHPATSVFGQLLRQKTRTEYLDPEGIRTLNNIGFLPLNPAETVTDYEAYAAERSALDIMETKLDSIIDCALACCLKPENYKGPGGIAGLQDLDEVLQHTMRAETPYRFSGREHKVPGYLGADGVMEVATTGTSFTHICKFPMIDGRESYPLLQWMGLHIARSLDIEVNEFSLMSQGPDLPPMLAIERFDLPPMDENGQPTERRLMQDFYTLRNLDPKVADEKTPSYASLGKVCDDLCGRFSPGERRANMENFISRILASYLTNDVDLHAKNLSVILTADATEDRIVSARLSPAYDIQMSSFHGPDGGPMYYRWSERQNPGGSQVNFDKDMFIHFLQHLPSVDGAPYCIFQTKEEAFAFLKQKAEAAATCGINIYNRLPPCVTDNKYAAMLDLDLRVALAVVVNRATKLGATGLPEFDKTGLKDMRDKMGSVQRDNALNTRGLDGYRQLVQRRFGFTPYTDTAYEPSVLTQGPARPDVSVA